MDILSDNFFPGRLYQDSFMHGKPRDRPREYPKLENKQRLNLPAMPHARFNKIPDRTHYRNDMQFGDGSDWATFPVMKLTQMGWVCDYDGVAMYGNCGNHASLDIIDAFHLKAWINAITLPINVPIISKWYNTDNRWYLYIDINQYISFRAMDEGIVRILGIGVSDLNVEQEYFVSFVWNENIGKIYVNGSFDANTTTNVPNDMTNLADVWIGYHFGGEYFNGTIAHGTIKALAESAAKQRDDYWRQA